LLRVKEEWRVSCKPKLEKDRDMTHKKWILAAAVGLLASFAATAQDAPELKTDKDKFSYALGMNFGEKLRQQGLDLDPAVFEKAFAESFAGGKTAMTDQDMQTLLTAAGQEIRKKMAAQQAEKGTAAQKEGEAFLAANKSKEDVVTLPSGLQYKILKAGTGEKPTLNDSVVCNYKGTLINGTEFDASEKHGGPATFPVKGVIAGWTEALQLMPTGSKWQLFVPSNLAYGPQGPGDIGPNATLIFEVELVSIQKSAAPAAAGASGSN
jgi:FKBP-type peptidyl-prolyl cis-trans isomerase FklB